MNVFITGGAGFIGSHLAERLVGEEHRVVVLDDLSTGSMRNLEPLLSQDLFNYRVDSITNRSVVGELAEWCDIVVHLAAAVGVKLIIERPMHTIETNVIGTSIVLEEAGRYGKTVLIASTSEVYGKGFKIPFGEDNDLILGSTANSRWAYACSKALDECLAFACAKEKGMSVIIARLFNTVGPRQTGHYGMVLPTFAGQALRGDAITVHGTGEQTRCFAHIQDVVEALIRLISTPKAVGEVFNVGSDHEITIYQLAEMVRDVAHSNSPIVFIPYDEAYGEGFEDMVRRVPDLRKLEEIIEYRPSTSLTKIVEDVVADQRRLLTGRN